MQRHEFNPIMAKLVLEFRATVDQALFEIYFQRFQHVAAESFRTACNACVVELDYFPSVHQILDRLPAAKVPTDFERARADVEKVRTEYESIFGRPDTERGPNDLESRIDALTDAELFEIFRRGIGEEVTINFRQCKTTEAGIWWSVNKFKANRNGSVYRGFVRDQLREVV